VKILRNFVIILTSIFLLNSCAALYGYKPEIGFNSEPAGADVYLNGDKIGTTPFYIKIKDTYDFQKKWIPETYGDTPPQNFYGPYLLEFEKEGYFSRLYKLDFQLNGLVFTLFILDELCFLAPALIDLLVGVVMYEPKVNHFNVKLERIEQ